MAKAKRVSRKAPPEQDEASVDDGPSDFDKAMDEIIRAEALVLCAKHSLIYRDDPNYLPDGDKPEAGTDDEIILLHEAGKVLHRAYELIDDADSQVNRERRARAKKHK